MVPRHLGLNLTLRALDFIYRVYLCVLYDYHNRQYLFLQLCIGGRNSLRVKCKGLRHGASFHGFIKVKTRFGRKKWHNLVNETNLVHDVFLGYFINFTYNLYIFRTSPGPSSGGTTVFMWHLVFVFIPSCIPDSQLYTITSTKCCISTVAPPHDGPGEVRNM